MGWRVAELIAAGRHVWLFFVMEVKRLVTYRVQFWCELVLSSLIELLVACSLWFAVFSAEGGGVIGSYTYPEMVLYVIIATFFSQAVKGTGVGTMAWEIYNGTLSKFLVYPLSVYSYKYGTYLPRGLFALGQLALALGLLWALGFWPSESSLLFSRIALAISLLLLSSFLYFLLIFTIECVAFWAEHVWALTVMLQFIVLLLSGKLIPLSLFPEWLVSVVSFTPFPYLVYFPVQVFLGEVALMEVLRGAIILSIWIFALYALSRLVYHKGTFRYGGVGI